MNVTLYIRDHCRFCDRALALLREKNIDVQIINAGTDEALKAEMIARSGGRCSFPQIFVGDKLIGGCDDLYALEKAGQLDALLQGEST